jgi:ribonuclease-3
MKRLRRTKEDRELEKKLGYRFRRYTWLLAALTHRSYRYETGDIDVDNQRLEFFGDAVLGFLVAQYLFDQYADRDEGFLTSLRSQTASGKALSGIARSIDLGRHIRMGKGEEASGGRKRRSTLADTLEAIIGAAYQDGGLKAAQKLFRTLLVPVLEDLNGDVFAHNHKGRLQEYAQRMWKAGPSYRLLQREGPAHASVFTSEVVLPDGRTATGQAPNKRQAEMRAAAAMLEKL